MNPQLFNPEETAKIIMSKSFLKSRGQNPLIKIASENKELALSSSKTIAFDHAPT